MSEVSAPESPSARYAAARDRLLIADAARLGRLLASSGKLRTGGGRGRGGFDAARFSRDIDAALLRADNRARLVPERIEYPEELPVSRSREEIQKAIAEHQVIVLCGETGSGKTTQLPKLCLEMGRGRRGLIGHTQPRRLAARSVANRIAQEMGSPLGGLVGYETRFDRRVSEQSLIKLMTDGILLAELQRDHELTAYDTIIIDEAHERSLNIDFLLGWLCRLLPRRPELKLIVTSATLDPERLAKHFGGAPILQVEGRTFPVTTRYREPDPDLDLEGQVADGIEELWAGGGRPGDVLVFLPGEREIRDLVRSLPGRFPRAEVLPLYSRLPAQQQDRVFGRGSAPRIVLATNVAETSVTVPGIRYVVDTGTARINRYSTRLGVQQLQIEAVSQAAANQRAGRCGRVGPGTCLRLYSEDDFKARDLFTDPEILRSNLAGVILQMAALGLGDVDDFPWVDAPENRHVSEGYRLLQTLGALDDERVLTPLGRELARLPLDPRIARIVAAGRGGPAQDAVCILAAALSVQDPHEVPPDQQTQARQKHAEWRHPRSDFFTLINLWGRWQQWSAGSSNRALRKACKEHYVSYLRMEEWEAVYKQIVDLLREGSGVRREAKKPNAPAVAPHPSPLMPHGEELEQLYAPIHKAIAAGLIDHIGLRLPAEKNERPEFQGPRGRKFRVFPGSVLVKKPPPWMLSAQLAQTSQLFARINAEVQPEWLAEVGEHLIKRTVTHPLWNAERGEVQCTEYHSLFGLQLLKRTRHYGSLEPVDARRIFILEGLVRGQWTAKPRFLADNLALVEDVQDKEARLRRPDLLGDEDQLFEFYNARIPPDVCTANTLKSWLRHATGNQGDPGRVLRMGEADVLRPGADADVESMFPDEIHIGAHSLKLSYQHDPGEDADGVSFHVPLSLLYQLPAAPFDWLVPGLRVARIEALIRSLPMNLRRQCTPAAEYAEALSARLHAEAGQGDFIVAICREFAAINGVQLKPADFDPSKLAAHLRPRLVLEDLKGKAIAEAESLAELQQRYTQPARAALTQSARSDDAARHWVREDVRDWDFGDLPAHVDLASGTRAYPALSPALPLGAPPPAASSSTARASVSASVHTPSPKPAISAQTSKPEFPSPPGRGARGEGAGAATQARPVAAPAFHVPTPSKVVNSAFADALRAAAKAAPAFVPAPEPKAPPAPPKPEPAKPEAAVSPKPGAAPIHAVSSSGERVRLVLLESPHAAAEAHAAGVRDLLLLKLADRTRDLARSARAKLNLLLIGAPYTPEHLAREVAERAAERAWPLATLRTEAAFKDALQRRGEFGRIAVALLDDVCDWLLTAADLRQQLRAQERRWPASLDDLQQQIDSLFAPGFVRALPEAQWPRVALWLKAAAIRLQRLPNKPQRDAELTAPIAQLAAKLPRPFHPARWLLEEWRVAIFAQELKAQHSPTAERVAEALKQP